MSEDSSESEELTNEPIAPAPHKPKAPELAGIKVKSFASCQELKACAKYLPVRLTSKERELLVLLEGALDVSEYTGNVDVYGHGKLQKQQDGLEDFIGVLLGLLISNNFKEGSKCVSTRGKLQNKAVVKRIVEVGRRYKRLNPEKMRTTYGKLLHILQDGCQPSLRRNYELTSPVLSASSFAANRHATAILDDRRLLMASAVVLASGQHDTQRVAEVMRDKAKAMADLEQEHVSATFSKDDLKRLVDSVSDCNNFLATNVDVVERMIQYLESEFHPTEASSHTSLAITSYRGGSRLTHDHTTQYYFVLQTLTLWKEILKRMFKLWSLAEHDFLSHDYRLCNTGQGLHRVQSAPRVAAEMQRILSMVQSSVRSPSTASSSLWRKFTGWGKGWIGLSTVHLGDRDVPNSFVFINKYTQVSQILSPILKVIHRLPELERCPIQREFLHQSFQSASSCRRLILRDFFRHGFNGSGSDGGSCIDGRLTSAWNWCSKLGKKSYHPVFMLLGFDGFDGDWRR